MTFPDGVETAKITISSGITPVGEVARVSAVVKTGVRIIHEASGVPIIPTGDAGVRTDDGIEFVLPLDDQAGFLDESGAQVTGWGYVITVSRTFPNRGGVDTVTRTIHLVSGQSVVDFDLIPDGAVLEPVIGDVGVVTSVNGRTGAVIIDGGGSGVPGPPGDDGKDGEDGAPGADGADGLDGTDGLSAYQIAVNAGFDGDESEWLVSLQGADGEPGTPGVDGKDGIDGDGQPGLPGVDGESAYDLAVTAGFVGTVSEWLDSLHGADGSDGEPGTPGTPGVDGKDGADGDQGSPGSDGTNGEDGADGADGKSAYELAVAGGYVGTLPAWLASLKGADGADGADGDPGSQGIPGADGADGVDGEKGDPGDPATVNYSTIPAGSTLTVYWTGTAWPARPTPRTDVTVQWVSNETGTAPSGAVTDVDMWWKDQP